MNNTVCDGNIIEYTNSTGSKINSGAVVVMGKFCGVAAVAVEGVFDLPKKTTTDTMAVGDALSYNSGVVKVAGSTGITIGKDVIVGYAVQASSSASTTVRAKLAH